jgi:hypothetical protein
MKILKFLAVAATVGGLAGCATKVGTTKTVYYADEHAQRGSISVVAHDSKLNNSLEFSPKRKVIEKYLTNVGYRVVDENSNPDFIAFVSYGISNGETETSSVPIFGQTGGGTTYHSGSVNSYGSFGNYSGTSYTMPTFGIVGSQTVSNTYYTRNIAIDIVLASSLGNESPKKMYEIRGKSVGSCAVIESVFESITAAMFEDFPGENGKPKNVQIEWIEKSGC